MLITLDPGIRGCGLAAFEAGLLVRATYVRNPTRKGDDSAAVRTMVLSLAEQVDSWGLREAQRRAVAVERPQIYAHGKGKGDPNQLIPLAEIGAGLVCCRQWTECITYKPREWKGTIDGDTMVARISATGPGALLLPKEHAIVEPPCASLAHNMWDAVGIGLFHNGRLTPKVYPGATPA